MQFHEDDRAQRLLDVFPAIDGQINVTYVREPGHVVAWHKHEIQTDYWCCLKGSFKVGLATKFNVPNPNGESRWSVDWEYLSDKDFRVLKIHPNIYHGYMALEPNSILMYYLTEKYNPKDEFRAEVGSFGEDWSIPNK